MKKITLFLGILLIPFMGFSQWIQLGEDFESLNEYYDLYLNYDPQDPDSYFSGGDEFGKAVALSADGSIMAVGAPTFGGSMWQTTANIGYVQVFRYSNDEWIQIGETLFGENLLNYRASNFGFSIDLSDDGNTLVVGEPYWAGVREDLLVEGGRLHVFNNINDQWVLIGEPVIAENHLAFGRSVSISSDGSIVAVGASTSYSHGGMVRTYQNVAGEWEPLGSEIAETGESGVYTPLMGSDVSLSADGHTLAVGGPNNDGYGQARLYEYLNDDWVLNKTIYGEAWEGRFGYSLSLSADGSRLAVSEYGALNFTGRTFIYDHIGDDWEVTQTFIGETGYEMLGYDVSLSPDGKVLVLSPGHTFFWPVPIKVYKQGDAEWVRSNTDNIVLSLNEGKVGLSWDGSVLGVGDHLFQDYPDGSFRSGRAYAYFDCSTVNISVTAEEVEPICEGEHTTLTAQIEQELYALNGTINWYENSDDTTPFHTGNSYETAALNQTTSFWVEGVTATGCPSERVEVTVTVLPIIAVVVGFSYGEICITDTVAQPILDNDFTPGGEFAADSSSISIDPLTGEIDVANSHTGTYTITYEIAEDEEVCRDSGSHSVDVVISSCFIQRGISPNGDGLNDYFDLTGMRVKRLTIYNRYGREVYMQSNYIKEWNGQDKNGNNLPTGTYFYAFENTEGEQTTGWIYINR